MERSAHTARMATRRWPYNVVHPAPTKAEVRARR